MRGTLLTLCAFLAVATARVLIGGNAQEKPHLIGGAECSWGPSYWCKNLTTAAGCKATRHCIESKWEKMEVEDDNDSVCDICKDMVKQARDQLESNQTQEDLKAVFEGSCALIHVKVIIDECDRLVDQFIPELVETLASQMDPSVVCSVSGLCNSKHIDDLLLDYYQKMSQDDVPKSLYNDMLEPDECSKCYTVATHLEEKLNGMSRDQVLENMLTVCGQLSSFSDACSSIILTYFNEIYHQLDTEFKADNICHLSGQCSSKFHKHEETDGKEIVEVEIRPLSTVGMVEVGDDLPCKLCEQLVGHLRDLLVANTTELEFQKVLQGLCKQTKSFSTECVTIVDQYYPEIYAFLTHNLDGNALCQMAGVCPMPGKSVSNGPISPLLPEKSARIAESFITMKKKHNLGQNGAGIRILYPKTEAEKMQLPLERMPSSTALMFPVLGTGNKQTCALCEYFLHYLQETITNPTTEDELKHEIEKVCKKLPNSVENECDQFVDVYGSALVAILAQEIDPSQVCPMIRLCPSEAFVEAVEAIPREMMIIDDVEDKPSCPLCLLAVTQLYSVVKDNKTEASIEAALESLCHHLPSSLKQECSDLVKIYSKELVDLILADFTPQEVCVYIKLCDATESPVPFYVNSFLTNKDGDIITNQIPDFPPYPVARQGAFVDNAECVVCEFLMKHLEESMNGKNSKDEIEKLVHGACHYLPKTIRQQCDNFVNQYADLVIDMLVAEVSPKDICTAISLCGQRIEEVQASVSECALCHAVISVIEKELHDPEVDHEIEHVVEKVCKYLPAGKQKKCEEMIEVYGQSIINLLYAFADPKKVCSKLALCSNLDNLVLAGPSPRMTRNLETSELGLKRCTWGDTYSCISMVNAIECNAVEHCQTEVWKVSPAKSI